MNKCQRQKLKLGVLHTLATSLAAVAAWYGGAWVSQHLDLQFTLTYLLGIALVGAGLGYLITRPMFQFTQECLSMDEAKTARQGTVNTTKRSATASAKSASAMPSHRSSAQSPAVIALSQGGTVFDGRRVSIVCVVNQSGRTVKVTTREVSNSQFKGNNGLRQRLAGISGISWQDPKNLGNGVRAIEGDLSGGVDYNQVADRLTTLASKFG